MVQLLEFNKLGQWSAWPHSWTGVYNVGAPSALIDLVWLSMTYQAGLGPTYHDLDGNMQKTGHVAPGHPKYPELFPF